MIFSETSKAIHLKIYSEMKQKITEVQVSSDFADIQRHIAKSEAQPEASYTFTFSPDGYNLRQNHFPSVE